MPRVIPAHTADLAKHPMSPVGIFLRQERLTFNIAKLGVIYKLMPEFPTADTYRESGNPRRVHRRMSTQIP